MPCGDNARMSLTIYHPRYQKLRAQMRMMRLSAGLTQEQMARSLNTTQSHISKIENGDRYIDVLFYIDWCVACGKRAEQAIADIA